MLEVHASESSNLSRPTNDMSEEHKCIYCGRPAKFQFKNGKWCCSPKSILCPVQKDVRSKKAMMLWRYRREFGKNNCTIKLSDVGKLSKQRQSSSVEMYDGIHCQYGCGQEAHFVLKNGVHCCCEHSTQCPNVRMKNSTSLKMAHSEFEKKTGMKNFWGGSYDDLSDDAKRRMCWMKGRTAKTDERVSSLQRKILETRMKMKELGLCKHSEETRRILSEQKKELYSLHPEKHPSRKVCGNFSKMTYPESVAYRWLWKSGYLFLHQYRFQYNGKHRFVDFYLPVQRLFIEIDGEFWHKDKKALDAEKDYFAFAYGIDTLRVCATDRIEDTLSRFLAKPTNISQ